MRYRHALLPVLLAVVAVTGCAARARSRVDAQQIARADALIADGCYDCLVESRNILTAAAGKPGSPAAIRAFAVQLLIVMREKELALDSTAALVTATQLAAGAAPVGTAPAVPAIALVDIVTALPADAVGTPRMDRQPARTLTDAIDRYRALPPQPLGLVGEYLAAAVACADPRPAPADAARAPLREDAPPLLVYQRAICSGRVDPAALERVRQAVPRFVETSLFRGRASFADIFSSDGAAARTWLEEAYARFPTSSAVTTHLGTLNQALGDCRAAMRYFDETIALREHHEDARLGRTICHTYLKEPGAAIAEATALFELRSYNQGEALYWRAWNRRDLKQLTDARADIEQTRTLLYNSRVLTLAGMIEHDQEELGTAERDFVDARRLDQANCTAAWYLGVVRYKSQKWIESADGFAGADSCYAAAVADTERRRQLMAARTDLDPPFRARQLAGFDAALQEDRSQRSAAALNAALNYARGNDLPNANKFMESAALDPERQASVEELRRAIATVR